MTESFADTLSPTPSTGHVEIWTDGSCIGNPGPGGWAWVATDGREGSGADPATTNQRMELLAIQYALREHPDATTVLIVTDSRYSIDCLTTWLPGWVRRDWVNSKNEPVKNRDVIEATAALMAGRSVEFRWVKGHAGTALNERADSLASTAARSIAGASRAATSGQGQTRNDGRRGRQRRGRGRR